jgi:hypothetical protein
MIYKDLNSSNMGRDCDGFPIDALAILCIDDWLTVLAAPIVYASLKRPVEPEVLLRLLDIYIAYVDRGDYYLFDHTPEPNRPALARQLRELIAGWTPPELPAEITEAARALLYAEGHKEPPHVAVTDPGYLESKLAWSDTEVMQKKATNAEREERSRERSASFRSKWLKGTG